YTYPGLQKNLEQSCDMASPPNGMPLKIRRYFMRCWRYIEAYSQQKDIGEAHEIVKKFTQARYTSHRRLGNED
ncbi:hypothetical protein BCR42DRAFT_339255, partial [Absidia repens]